MPSIGDIAEVLRSKNAGPFEITIDMLFEDAPDLDRVIDSQVLTKAAVAELYGAVVDAVRIVVVRDIMAIKVTFPRPGPSSGAPGDSDVYGAQQHAPLAGLAVP